VRKELLVPVDGKLADWPRRVAKVVLYLLGRDDALVAAESAITALQSASSDHETRIGAAESDISALESRVLRASGTPEGAVTAAVGTLYLRTDGGAATTLYVKESGAGNTGWVAK